jgi:hypothetical protein
MPDITMCPSELCLLKETCYRSSASGTKPDEFMQSWFMEPEETNCDYYWPVRKPKVKTKVKPKPGAKTLAGY